VRHITRKDFRYTRGLGNFINFFDKHLDDVTATSCFVNLHLPLWMNLGSMFDYDKANACDIKDRYEVFTKEEFLKRYK
jgi:hypothetical protein